MAKFAPIFLFAATAFASSLHAQSISVGHGRIIYQILFSQWANPAGKLFTGAPCHFLKTTCDTRFTGYVEILSDASTVNSFKLTWPGPNTDTKNWPIIGESSYKSNGLTDFAYLNLTGVEKDKFRAAFLRVKVKNAGLTYSDAINAYITPLPGLRDIGVTQYEADARFSLPIELGSLSSTLPEAVEADKKTNRDADQQMHLFVKVRAWGEDIPAGSIGKSGGYFNGVKKAGVGGAISPTVRPASNGTLADIGEISDRRRKAWDRWIEHQRDILRKSRETPAWLG